MKTAVPHQLEGVLPVLLCLCGKATDDVGEQINIRDLFPQATHEVEEVLDGVLSLHGLEHSIRTRLNWDVHEAIDIRPL